MNMNIRTQYINIYSVQYSVLLCTVQSVSELELGVGGLRYAI